MTFGTPVRRMNTRPLQRQSRQCHVFVHLRTQLHPLVVAFGRSLRRFQAPRGDTVHAQPAD